MNSGFLAADVQFVANRPMLLAHLTDLHLPLPAAPRRTDLLNKRALGYLSWRTKRRHRHTRAALDALVGDLKRRSPALTALSGDLANISLEAEFHAIDQWLRANFEAQSCALCPGNHDAYVALPWERSAGVWSEFMRGDRFDDARIRPPAGAADFPFVRETGPAALIFANSAVATAPGLATGRLGAAQRARIGLELDRLGACGRCRILVLHHPITDGVVSRRKALDDAAALRAVIAASGVELVLHGHTHRSEWNTVETRDGPRPVVGGGAASHPVAHGRYAPARYNLFAISGDARAGWRIEAEVRELDPATGDVRTAETRLLLAA
jgi:3',5'-cyclic AMP phosphodiesterase CpdA